MGKKILWIEDDAQELKSLVWPLEDKGYKIDFALDARQGEDLATKNKYDMIILDILLPSGEPDLSTYVEFTGVTVAERIREKRVDTPMIALTVVNEPAVVDKLKELNVLKILHKGSILPSSLMNEIEEIIG